MKHNFFCFFVIDRHPVKTWVQAHWWMFLVAMYALCFFCLNNVSQNNCQL